MTKEAAVPGSSPHQSAKDLTLRVFEFINRGEFDRLHEVLADDLVAEWPQSGERIRGADNMAKLLASYPGGLLSPSTETAEFVAGDEDRFLLTPMFTMVRAEGTGDSAVGSMRTRYPDGSDWYIISIAHSADNKLTHLVQYFAPVYDAPEWRSEWVEPVQ